MPAQETQALPGLADPYTEALRGLNLPPPYIHRNILCGLSATLAPGVVRQEIVAYRIPAGLVAVISGIANGLGNISDGPFVIWSLTVDGSDVVGFSGLIGPVTPAVTAPKSVGLLLNADQRVAWVASNTGASIVQQAAAMFTGWMWDPRLRPSGYTP